MLPSILIMMFLSHKNSDIINKEQIEKKAEIVVNNEEKSADQSTGYKRKRAGSLVDDGKDDVRIIRY